MMRSLIGRKFLCRAKFLMHAEEVCEGQVGIHFEY